MKIDFGRLGSESRKIQLEPRDIFMSLPSRDKQYEYPRDVQSEVWKQWFIDRNKKNCIIKMNTGSGKTVVGLIILKSCLNEGKGPAVYVVPDNYLVKQVCTEAERLGIKVTNDEEDIEYMCKRAILVINIQKLINGKSVFGMRINNNVPIGSIVVDDMHACLATIESQYTVNIPAGDAIYNSIFDLFTNSMITQSESKYSDIKENIPFACMLIPFWDWQSKADIVYNLLNRNIDKHFIGFNFPLIKDCLKLCNCVITSKCIEITPKCIPIHKITSFERAERRIFMSATLSDDSVFVSALGLQTEDISSIISPEKANDIGDRLIVFPQVMNKQIAEDEIKIALKEISTKHNVVVIVPSYYRAKFWSDVADIEISSTNIDQAIVKLKNEHVGIAVLINKYDGIDLPEDACRYLVIDGLPRMQNEYDLFEQNAYPNSKRLCSEQIQKIEQGMGRGVRSNNDYCVVMLIGRNLADVIYGQEGKKYFSDATQKQFDLSEELWNQLKNPSINDIIELSNYCLKRDVGWITVSKDRLSAVNYTKTPRIYSTSIAMRRAFNAAENGRYQDAINVLTTEKNQIQDIELRGFLKQLIADYTNFINPAEAQEILLSANNENRMLLRPLQGIQYTRVINSTGTQAQFFLTNIAEKQLAPNNYVLKVNGLLEQLSFIPDTANIFENALKELSFLIGIYSSRPEAETGKGPDNFWDIGNSNFFVIESKNGTITETICKHDCNQLNGSINWFTTLYRDGSHTCYPIMIHNSNVFEYACSPNKYIRIMTPDLLDKFKNNVESFAHNITNADAYNNIVKINQLLAQFKLLGTQIIDNYTVQFKVKNR